MPRSGGTGAAAAVRGVRVFVVGLGSHGTIRWDRIGPSRIRASRVSASFTSARKFLEALFCDVPFVEIRSGMRAVKQLPGPLVLRRRHADGGRESVPGHRPSELEFLLLVEQTQPLDFPAFSPAP